MVAGIYFCDCERWLQKVPNKPLANINEFTVYVTMVTSQGEMGRTARG